MMKISRFEKDREIEENLKPQLKMLEIILVWKKKNNHLKIELSEILGTFLCMKKKIIIKQYE